MEQLKKYVELYIQKDKLEDSLKRIKDELGELEDKVLDFMQENGIQNIKVDDRMVYLRRDIRASFLGTPEAFAELEQQGLMDALTTTVHPSRASSIVREVIADLDKRPSWIDKTFNVFEGYRAAVRKS